MVDVGAIHFAKSERNKIVLVPQPSNDSSDPLVSSYIIRRNREWRANIPGMTSYRIGARSGRSQQLRLQQCLLSLKVLDLWQLRP